MRVIIGPLILGIGAATALGLAGRPAAASAAVLPGTVTGAVTGTSTAAGAASAGVVAAAVASVLAAVTVAAVAVVVVVTSSTAAGLLRQAPIEEGLAHPAVSQPVPTPKPTTPPTSSPAQPAAPTPDPIDRPDPVSTPDRTPPGPPLALPTLAIQMEEVGDLVRGRAGEIGFTASNPATTYAQAVVASVALPDGATLDTSKAVQGAGWTCVPAVAGATCTTFTLAPGATSTVFVPVSVDSSADTVALPSVTLGATEFDPVSASASEPIFSNGMGTAFAADGSYSVALAGATLVSCDAALAGCTDARNGVGDPNMLDNNDWQLFPLDQAGLGTNSSTSSLYLPGGAQVAFAKLYWSGQTPDEGQPLNQASIRQPGSEAWTPIEATHIDYGKFDNYQASADVTELVRAGGDGQWAVGGVSFMPSTGGAENGYYAGWALVVVYEDASLTPGRVLVLDGMDAIPTDVTYVNIGGLASSEANVGAVAWEGDFSAIGDDASLEGTALVRDRAGSTADNAFRSLADGSSWVNSFGVDVGTFGAVPFAGPRSPFLVGVGGDDYSLGALTVVTR